MRRREHHFGYLMGNLLSHTAASPYPYDHSTYSALVFLNHGVMLGLVETGNLFLTTFFTFFVVDR